MQYFSSRICLILKISNVTEKIVITMSQNEHENVIYAAHPPDEGDLPPVEENRRMRMHGFKAGE